MSRVSARGFTLIEVIIFIVVVSVGLTGILLVSNTVTKSSADPLVNKQATALAQALLEEILLKSFCEPTTANATTTPPTCGAPINEGSRGLFNDVDDYIGYSTTGGVVDVSGVALAGLAAYNYSPAVSVVPTSDLPGIAAANAKRITVSVTGPGGTVSLSGYRTNF